MTKYVPPASKMEPKTEVRHPLNRHPPGDPVKKGAMCNSCIIYYVSNTSALLEKVTFSLDRAAQNEEKIGSAAEVAKKHRKHQAKSAEGEPKVRRWLPKGSTGSPNGFQILSKFINKRGLCPGAPPKAAKGTPAPSKMSKIVEKLASDNSQ